MDIEQIVKNQRALFNSGKTKNIQFRKQALKTLKECIIRNETDIKKALYEDLHKAGTESYFSEIGMVLSELSFIEKHFEKWAKKQYTLTPLAQFYGTSYAVYEPYGVALIMSPWNYPFMLTLDPLIGAIAAGNCVVLKPSAYAPHVSDLLKKMMEECFDASYICVIEGGREENTLLLEQHFDYIFFTGGVTVGKFVMEKAARYATPITLELGGKSPCIIDKSANLKVAAKRIAFGKYLNAGQTCVAPDYLFIHHEVKEEFVKYFKGYVIEFFGNDPLNCEELPKIINEKHFHRLCGLMEHEDICMGGDINPQTLQIAPTLLDHVNMNAPIMQEEIFGPILPMITYDSLDEVIDYVTNHEKSLALYLFTRDKEVETKILNSCSFGGGCINDTIIHLATSRLGFGGVGGSGMGNYHGKRSFTTFSHEKSIVKKANWIDLPFRYHPYTKSKEKIIKLFMK